VPTPVRTNPIDLLRAALMEQTPGDNGQSRYVGTYQPALALNAWAAGMPLTNEQQRESDDFDLLDQDYAARQADRRKQNATYDDAITAANIRGFENRKGVKATAEGGDGEELDRGGMFPHVKTRGITRLDTGPEHVEMAREAEGYADPNFSKIVTGRRQLASADPKVVAANPFLGGGAASGATGDAALEGLDAGTAMMVKKLANYDLATPSGMALRTPYWQQLLQRAALYDPTFDQTQYDSRKKLRSDFSSGSGAKNIRSLNTAVGHLDTLSDAAAELGNTSVPFVNSAKNWVLSNTGDPRVVKFTVAANAVESELAALFKGMGATDQEIKAWRAALNASESPEQLTGAIKTAVELMGSRQNELERQWTTGMGKPADFKIVSDKSRAILDRLQGGALGKSGAGQEYDYVNGKLVPRGAK
jgi:hypothetical protein